jgi:hypothetical protein
MKKLDKLKSLMGKKYKHEGGAEFIFYTHKIDKDKVTIVTDSEWLIFNLYDIDVFMEKYKEIVIDANNEVMLVSKKEQSLPAMKSVNTDVINSLKDILISNIDKVQKDRDYVNQAKIVCNSVQGIVNLAKLELDIRKNL